MKKMLALLLRPLMVTGLAPATAEEFRVLTVASRDAMRSSS